MKRKDSLTDKLALELLDKAHIVEQRHMDTGGKAYVAALDSFTFYMERMDSEVLIYQWSVKKSFFDFKVSYNYKEVFQAQTFIDDSVIAQLAYEMAEKKYGKRKENAPQIGPIAKAKELLSA